MHESNPGCRAAVGPVHHDSAFGGAKIVVVPVIEKTGGSSAPAKIVYRCAEVLLSLIGLIFLSPIMLIEAILIRVVSPGPALLFTKRVAQSARVPGDQLVGRDDIETPDGEIDPNVLYYVPRTYRLLKFRSMHIDAKERFPELYDYEFSMDEFRTRQWKLDHDPRIIPLGRWLRKTSIDEIPNLWNVVVGDMRLVGPRAELPEILRYHTAAEMYRFSVKPGVTSLAMVNGRNRLTKREELAMDMEYVKRRSVALDIGIILKTIWCVVTGKGAM